MNRIKFIDKDILFSKINNTIYTVKDDSMSVFWARLSKFLIKFRYYYITLPLFIKLLIGLPVLLWSIYVYIVFAIFIIWTDFLDDYIQYDHSSAFFSLKKYFITNMLKLFLFLLIVIFIALHIDKPFSWLGFLYTVPMCALATAYTVPLFDKILYSNDMSE